MNHKPKSRIHQNGIDRAYTLIEIMIAVVLALMVMAGTIGFMRMGQQTVVKVSDHADARMEAMRILDQVDWDLNRLVIGDDIEDPEANVKKPFQFTRKKGGGGEVMFGFYAFHHYEYAKLNSSDPNPPRMRMFAGWIDYRKAAREKGRGVDLLRNDKPVNKFALHDVKIEFLPEAEAQKLNILPQHCITMTIEPMGQWDQYNEDIWKKNAIRRVFHLKAVESRFACLMSMKRAIESNPDTAPKHPGLQNVVSFLSDVTDPGYVPPPGPPVILAWMQPQLTLYPLNLPRTTIFDDKSVDDNKLPAPGTVGPELVAPYDTNKHPGRGTCTNCHTIK